MQDSSVSRVIGVLTSPERTYRSIRERPTWLVALAAIVLIGAGVYFVMSQRMDMGEIVRESIEQSGREVTEDQLEGMIDFYDRFGSVFSIVMIIVGSPIFYLLGTLGLWVVVRLVGADLSFKQGFSTFVHAQMPQVVASLLSLPAILSRPEFHFEDVQTGSVLPSNLGYLAPEEASPALLALLSSIDVFTIWTLVLLVIGIATVGRLKRRTAAVGVGICWALYVLGKAGWAAIFG